MRPEHQDRVWRMLKQIYGRRKATRKHADRMTTILVEKRGLEQCRPALHLSTDVSAEASCHVDDYHACGPLKQLEELRKEISKHVRVKVVPPRTGRARRVRVLEAKEGHEA